MSDFPGLLPVHGERLAYNLGSTSAGDLLTMQGSSMSVSAAWPSANLAIFQPVLIDGHVLLRQMSIENGATASGNLDVGLYGELGNLIVSSGSTAQSGTSTIQVFNLTDTELNPGLYYMALVMNGTTGTTMRTGTAAQSLRTMGIQQMATAFPLPSTATFAAMAQAYCPHVAMHTVATV